MTTYYKVVRSDLTSARAQLYYHVQYKKNEWVKSVRHSLPALYVFDNLQSAKEFVHNKDQEQVWKCECEEEVSVFLIKTVREIFNFIDYRTISSLMTPPNGTKAFKKVKLTERLF